MAIVQGRVGGRGFFANILSDPSVISLLATNLPVIALAIVQNWNLITITC